MSRPRAVLTVSILIALAAFIQGCNMIPTSPTTDSSGGIAGNNCGGRYTGAGSRTVYDLLSWVDSSVACSGSGSPPSGSNWNMIANGSCIRDQYVAAAITYAWGASAYAYQGSTAQARSSADSMCVSLKQADQLCSNAPVIGPPRSCITEQIYACGANGAPGFATRTGCP